MPRLSGGFPSIEMMQPADLGDSDHLAKRGRLDRSADRGIFFEGEVGSVSFVVLEVVFQDSTQPSFIEDHDMVKAFAANRTDKPLDIGVGTSIQLRRIAMLKFDVSE